MFHFDLEEIKGFWRLFLWSLWLFVRVVSAIQYCLPKFLNSSTRFMFQSSWVASIWSRACTLKFGLAKRRFKCIFQVANWQRGFRQFEFCFSLFWKGCYRSLKIIKVASIKFLGITRFVFIAFVGLFRQAVWLELNNFLCNSVLCHVSESVVVKHNKLFKQIRHAWHFWFAAILVFTE